MAKARKVKEVKEAKVKEPKEKKSSLFDLISFLTNNKKPWHELSDDERKTFSPYMINRFLSMEVLYAPAINEIQKTTLSSMTKEELWGLYYHLLPENKVYLKYIKNQTEVPQDDLDALKSYFKVSLRECEDYWIIAQKTNEGREFIEQLKANFVYEKK